MNRFQIRSISSGFTLIELVAVIVILSILAVIGSSFMIKTTEGYHQSVNRSQLIQTGRQAIERINRQLRIAVPNSVRVSANSRCVEWLPIVAGGNYLGVLPDSDNTAPATSTLSTAPISFDIGTPRYLSVGALSSNELYGTAPVSLAQFNAADTSVIPNILSLSAPKQFARNSINRRLFIADAPNQFCVSGGNLTFHSGYTGAAAFPAIALSGTPPNAGTLLATGVDLVSETPFALEAGTEARNTIINIQLPFARRGERVVLQHQVMVRNVP